MNLVDPAAQIHLAVYEELVGEYPDLFTFNPAEVVELPEPWHWDWKSPARALTEQLLGRADVTAWTQEDGLRLRGLFEASEEAG